MVLREQKAGSCCACAGSADGTAREPRETRAAHLPQRRGTFEGTGNPATLSEAEHPCSCFGFNNLRTSSGILWFAGTLRHPRESGNPPGDVPPCAGTTIVAFKSIGRPPAWIMQDDSPRLCLWLQRSNHLLSSACLLRLAYRGYQGSCLKVAFRRYGADFSPALSFGVQVRFRRSAIAERSASWTNACHRGNSRKFTHIKGG